MLMKKRGAKRAMHASNKYAENPPDFNLLASLYPSFKDYVSYDSNKKPRVDWTDFNATRELTRVLLKHDYGLKWWIPDGQLCPTVTNRLNYLHWVQDLLSFCPAPWHASCTMPVKGIDIGTGANCIYPLLGASLHGWHFVGTDVTSIALKWAKFNVMENPQFSNQIEIRRATFGHEDCQEDNCPSLNPRLQVMTHEKQTSEDGNILSKQHTDSVGGFDLSDMPAEMASCSGGSPVLLGVVMAGENFDFCMCNPPFFESIEEAGRNPHTACGGTVNEMVCPGGELSFITQIVEDSLQLRNQIQWYTSMVGRKVNLKTLVAKLRGLGVTMLRTTEFVQGRTSRWGVAWSFASPQNARVALSHVVGRTNISFMIEGAGQQCSAIIVLQALASQLQEFGALTTLDIPSFSITGTFSSELLLNKQQEVLMSPSNNLSFKALVFQQAPGCLLIKFSLLKGQSSQTSKFSWLVQHVESGLKKHFRDSS